MNRFQHRQIFIWLTAMLMVVCQVVAVSSISLAQAGTWSNAISLSSAQATGWFPDIAADSTGRIHVAWAGGTTGYDTVLYTSTTDGLNWSPINDVEAIPQVGTDSSATRPALWVDNIGNINLSYVSTILYYSHSPASKADSASAWSSAQQLNSGQVAYFSRIIQDNLGQLHLFYTENSPSNSCGQCYHLFHRVSTDMGANWSDAQDISADGTGAAKPQVIADKKGGLYVAWESGTGGGLGQLADPTVVKFNASHDGGKTWSGAVTLSPADVKEAKNITIGLDGQGNLVSAWLDLADDTINTMISVDGGKTWSIPAPINGVAGGWDIYPTKLDDYSMATDSSGKVHLLVVGHLAGKDVPTPTSTSTPTEKSATETPAPTTLDLIHLTWQGGSWSSPDIVTSLVGDVPEWPRLVVSNGNILNAVWFVRDQADIWNSDNAHYKIWYSRAQVNAPAIAPFTPVPTTAPTATPPVEMQDIASPGAQTQNPTSLQTPSGQTISAFPTLTAEEKDPSKAIYSENDFIGVIARALIPAVVVVLTLGLYFIFRRRR